MAFNGDQDPSASKLKFYKYFFEPLAQDHPEFTGGGSQIGLDGAPLVEALEEWDEAGGKWKPCLVVLRLSAGKTNYFQLRPLRIKSSLHTHWISAKHIFFV